MRIVENGYKIDLHIHSVYSRVKDAKKVSFNTIDHIVNIPLLMSILSGD